MTGSKPQPPWRVGVLFSSTGVTAAVERTQQAAMLRAIEEVNASGGVLGRPIAPVVLDPASRPPRYRELAKQLCDQAGVAVIFGCYMSSTRKAVLPVVEAHRARHSLRTYVGALFNYGAARRGGGEGGAEEQ